MNLTKSYLNYNNKNELVLERELKMTPFLISFLACYLLASVLYQNTSSRIAMLWFIASLTITAIANIITDEYVTLTTDDTRFLKVAVKDIESRGETIGKLSNTANKEVTALVKVLRTEEKQKYLDQKHESMARINKERELARVRVVNNI